ncbi:hypothetical protein J2T60_002089 [Natronospira proteinivora]|uniref:Uncharacterized protein n=1 Tax=Natronospira proteinivora TaxID=1807133 RepID=A0ABT1G9T9_9GAMM|nr:hypothetical protein [Natronospira proteinivora]MCP1728089.1 hypothetical protein [Natronospira proteinivora]
MDVQALIIEALTLFFMLVGLMAAALGLILMLAPDGFERIAAGMNREWSTRRAMKDLEIPRYYERFFYRHHRWTGGLLLAAAAYFFLAFALQHSPAELGATLPGLAWVWESVFWLLIVANLTAAVLALVILMRPSTLKPLERAANRWVSVRRATRGLNPVFHGVEQLARRHHRAVGFLLLLAGGFLLVSFGVLYTTG